MGTIGIKESIYRQLRDEGHSALEALELVEDRYKELMKELEEKI